MGSYTPCPPTEEEWVWSRDGQDSRAACRESNVDSTVVYPASLLMMRVVRKVKNVCAYNPRSYFIVPDESFGVFSRV